MKTGTSKRSKMIHPRVAGLAICACLCGPLTLAAPGQDAKPVAAPTVNAPAKDATVAKPEKKDAPAAQPTAYPPVSIAEVLKMIDAGVSPEIIKAYVEGSPAAYNPNAADLITLKTNGVPDDVTAALMKRVAEIKSINKKTRAEQAAVERSAGPAPMDPESYDFWWYNHGYPRVMASTYRQLDPYPGGAYYSYGASFYPRAPYYPTRDLRARPNGPGPYGPGKRLSNRSH